MPTLDHIKSAQEGGIKPQHEMKMPEPPKPTQLGIPSVKKPNLAGADAGIVSPTVSSGLGKSGSAHPLRMAKEAMVKAAAEINNLQAKLTKQANYIRANKIAYNLAMDGRIDFSEIMDKTAELQTKNLDVIEEAIKLGYQSQGSDIGRVDTEDNGAMPGDDTDPITATLLRLR